MSTPPARPGPEPVARPVAWDSAIRIIASRYPPIELFERVSADPLVWEALIEAEVLTNPRIRDEIGQIRLVVPEERISGPGASWVMASFTHLNPRGSRFSDGRYGVYYAARELQTAIRETAHHFALFAADSGDGARYEDMRVLAGRGRCRVSRCREPAAGRPPGDSRSRRLRRRPIARRAAARGRQQRRRLSQRAACRRRMHQRLPAEIRASAEPGAALPLSLRRRAGAPLVRLRFGHLDSDLTL